MNLRFAAIGAAIVLVFLAATLFLASSSLQPAQQPPQKFSAGISLLGAGLANRGEGNVAYANIDARVTGAESGSLELLWVSGKPLTEVIFLEYPMLEADKYDEFRRSLISQLSQYGFTASTAPLSKALAARNTVIVVPTGILPRAISDGMGTLLENGNHVIFIGRMNGFVLEPDASIAKETSANRTASAVGSAASSAAGSSGCFFSTGKPLNEFSSAEDASSQFFHFILTQACAAPIATGSHALSEKDGGSLSGRLTLATEEGQNRNAGFALLISTFQKGNKSYKSASYAELAPLSGELRGPSSIFPGEPLHYKIYLNETRSTPALLVLRASALKGGAEFASAGVGEANIKDVWLSSFDFPSSALAPGDYITGVSDQFGTRRAAAFLHVKNLSISLAGSSPPYYALSVLLDGKPIDSEFAQVSLEGSNISERYSITGGKLTVAARPQGSEGSFIVRTLGQTRQVRFTNEGEGTAGIYLKFGLPGLLLIIIIYLYFKRKPQQIYRVSVQPEDKESPHTIELSWSELTKIFDEAERSFGWSRVPLSLAELKSGIGKHFLKKGKDITITDDNLIGVLASLEAKKRVAAFRDYFAPAAWLKGTPIEHLVLRRLVRDALIERGVKFEEGKFIAAKTSRGILQFCIYEKDDDISKMDKKAKKAVLFESSDALERFRRLLRSGTTGKAKLSVMLQTGSLILITPEEINDVL